jgi:predicted RNase H-like nuclease
MPHSHRGAPLPYRVLAGVVPCPGGWLVASAKLQGITLAAEPPVVYRTLIEILDYRPAFSVIGLAVPVGLLDEPRPGGRSCDREARHVLGRPRSAAVISAPSRADLAAIGAGTPGAASHVSVIVRQLAARYREADEALSPYWQRTVFEVHPELSYHQINEDRPMHWPKHSAEGMVERQELLVRRFQGVTTILETKVKGANIAHLADAAAALWTARRVAARAVIRIPEMPEWDSKGLRMEIVR